MQQGLVQFRVELLKAEITEGMCAWVLAGSLREFDECVCVFDSVSVPFGASNNTM